MNLVDILIWVVLLVFSVKGFMKGLVREVCSLLGLVVGGWAAITWYRPFAEVLQSHCHFSHTVTLILSFGLIFLGFGIFFVFLGYLLTVLLKVALLNSLNRMGGVFLGLVQGGLILCVLLTLGTAGIVPIKVRSCVEKSAAARPFLVFGKEILSWWDTRAHAVRKNKAAVSSPSI